MWKKIIFLILVVIIIISWPISLVKKKANFGLETIFYPVSQDEEWAFQKKLALDTSQIKKFYYNKTTIIKDRYFKNLLVLTDLNNYFFSMHPREDISGVDYRFKYPFWTIIFLVLGIKATVKNKKYTWIWELMLFEMLVLSFLKQMDGWDIILFLPISWLMILGVKEIL
ncbi:MAG: hypothetical protein WC895_03660 [Candidatus Shapirobacteria bacterium]|jgi:hypothetical protein